MVTLRLGPPVEMNWSTLSAVAAPEALICNKLLTSAFTAPAADANASGVDTFVDAELITVRRFARMSAAAVALLERGELSWFSMPAIELTSAKVVTAEVSL